MGDKSVACACGNDGTSAKQQCLEYSVSHSNYTSMVVEHYIVGNFIVIA